jgi:hypothetical protein
VATRTRRRRRRRRGSPRWKRPWTIGAMNGSLGQRHRRYRTFTPGFVEDSPPATARTRRRPRCGSGLRRPHHPPLHGREREVSVVHQAPRRALRPMRARYQMIPDTVSGHMSGRPDGHTSPYRGVSAACPRTPELCQRRQ